MYACSARAQLPRAQQELPVLVGEIGHDRDRIGNVRAGESLMNAEELTKLIERLCELGRTGSVLRLLAWVLQLDSVRGMSIVSGLRDQWKPLLNAIPPRRTQTLCKAVQEILSHLPDADLTEFLHDLESADARLWSERRLLGSTSGSSRETARCFM